MYGGGGVWARGDIRGNLVAERRIGGEVFAFGEISAQILARNSSQDPYGGTIGTVAAWGPIAGWIEAETSIGLVRSGGAVTAEIRAPLVGAVIENDPSILTDYDYPDVPDSIRDALLAEAAAARAGLLADRDDLAAEIDQLMADFADERNKAFADLATARADIDETIEEIAVAAHEALANDRMAISAAFDEHIDKETEVFDDLQTLADEMHRVLIRRVELIAQASAARYRQALADRQQLEEKFGEADAQIADHRDQDSAAVAGGKENRNQDWEEFQRSLLSDLLTDLAEKVNRAIPTRRFHTPGYQGIGSMGSGIEGLRLKHQRMILEQMREALKRSVVDLSPTEQVKAQIELEQFLLLAANTPSQWRLNDCWQWFQDVMKQLKVVKYFKVSMATWDYPLGVPTSDWWLGHEAIKVTLRDGSVFYLDNGWWGPLFLPEDVPVYATEYKPVLPKWTPWGVIMDIWRAVRDAPPLTDEQAQWPPMGN